jgi:hypothetical protein
MPKKRIWANWPKRIANELNIVSGIAGVGAAAVGIAGLSLFDGWVRLITSTFGLFVFVITLGLAIYRSFPVPAQYASDLVGKVLSVRDLSDIYPTPIKFAIVGPSMSGKTTLRNRLSFVATVPTRTQSVIAQIIALQTAPPKLIAILDGGGEKLAQQFDLAEYCDYLCLLIDHNSSDVDIKVDQGRLQQHAEFLKQIRHFLDENEIPTKISIRILLNKRDLWERASQPDLDILKRFQEDELRYWKEGSRGRDIAVQPHSNDITEDVSSFVDYLKNCAVGHSHA